MWRILILSLLITATNSESIDPFLGNWTVLVIYPSIATIPHCLTYDIQKDERNDQCTCVDGKKSTLINIKLSVGSQASEAIPTKVVDSPAEVIPLLNVSCKCGDGEFDSRMVLRYVSENYIVLYFLSRDTGYTIKGLNNAYLAGKEIPTTNRLLKDLKEIDEFKDKENGAICTQDVVKMYKN